MPKFRVQVWSPDLSGPYEVEVSANTSFDAQQIVSRRDGVDIQHVLVISDIPDPSISSNSSFDSNDSTSDSNIEISGKTWLFIIAIFLLISYPLWILVFLGIVGVIWLFKKNIEDGYF